ncbi:Ribulose-phosphate 3-epimerase [Coxiella-like endosymbiont]|uniref:ribulose-phosphate 3-epimerase n=1 Tax=Coxiella endosymbiont of Rhipicephalus microplus TaxID=1656186 RepID=UPI000C8099DC|nr:ribulose-phosphate 3-epimerase [Coxiella endosymbiont of Rhipicephalus microplus]PMB54797.1 Ribulose-phosphate 3-epimerase [Coxiella-like endosymbiont]
MSGEFFQKKIISASILSANFARLGEEVEQVVEAGVDYIHFDVMDHHFVPNLSFGPVVCEALRKAGISIPIDVHLMVENPNDFIKAFANAGANLITFHVEKLKNIEKTLTLIDQSGMKKGLAFNPEQSVLLLPDDILKEVDLILLMSVNPGFAGQSFIKKSLEKIIVTKKCLEILKSKAMLGIDGGIKVNNIGAVSKAGANFFVVGSGLFHALNYQKEIQGIRAVLI